MNIQTNYNSYIFSNECERFLYTAFDTNASYWNCQTGVEQKIQLQRQLVKSQIQSFDIFKKKGNEILAFGSTNGKIVLYKLKTQEFLLFNKNHTEAVLDLKFNDEGNYLYSISQDKLLYKYDLTLKEVIYTKIIEQQGSIQEAHIVSTNDNIIYSYNNKIVLLDTLSDVIIKKYKGHSSNVKMLKVCKNNQYFATYSDEGFINVYNVNEEKPIHSVSIISKSTMVNMVFENFYQNNFVIICLFNEMVESWEFQIKGKNQIQQNLNKSFSLSNNNLLYFASNKLNQSNVFQLSVAFGNNSNIKFKRINPLNINKQFDYKEMENSFLQILAENQQKVISSKNNELNNFVEKDGYVVNENNMMENQVIQEEKQTVEEDINQLEEFIQEKQNVDSVKNLSIVLSQSLHNNDNQLIDFCLEKEGEDIIQQTVMGLKSAYVGTLIEKIFERLNSFPYKAKQLTIWLKNIMKYHQAIIIASPFIQKKIQPLIGSIQTRSKNLNKLIQLKSKIEMIQQIKQQLQIQTNILNNLTSEEQKRTPLFIFEEGSQVVQEQVQQNDEFINDLIDDSIEDEESDKQDKEEEEEDEEQFSDEEDVNDDFDKAAKQYVYNNINKEVQYNDKSDQASENNLDSDFIEV